MKTYIITGGAGFIGSHLIEKIISLGNNVICIDDLSSGFKSNIESLNKISFFQNKVQEFDLKNINNKIDGIFHLAAQASVPKSIEMFYESSKNNLLGTLKVFDWARQLNIPIVYASSSAIYGNLPIGDDEKNNFEILSPYAQDKLTMEHYALLSNRIYNISSIGLRFFNVYGPKQDPNSPYSGVISIFIDRLNKKQSVTINGGYQTRDFIYVSDIVDTLFQSMNLLHKQNKCFAINVGTGRSITIDELLQKLITIYNYSPNIIKKTLPVGDPEKSSGVYNKLINELHINNDEFIDLEKGLLKTVNYYRNNE